jgi:membrane fusion protein
MSTRVSSSSRALFRPEAVEFQQQRRDWGDVASLQPFSTKVFSWLLVVCLICVVVFLSIAKYARKETVVGYLTPTRGTAKIFVPKQGTIRDVHVHEGVTVRAGQPLLTVETDQFAADGSDVNATLLETLQKQKELLTRNMESEEQRTSSEQGRLTALQAALKAEISQLQAQLTLQDDRLQLVNQELQAAQQLRSKGYTTVVELRRRQLAAIEHQQVLSGLKQRVSAKQNQLSDANFALDQLPTVMDQKVQIIRNDLAATEQRIAEIKGRAAYVIRAPVAGRVSTLQATAGQNADLQRLQLELIPEDAVLRADLFVPARAIGFVKAGQDVRILYDAFPYQHFGTYQGEVVKVSQTLLTSNDAAGPIKLNEPAYRVLVSLERPDIDAYGSKIALQPDMLLRADIILERRSLLNWLTNRLQSLRM